MHLIIKHSNQSFNHFKPVTNFILCVYRVLKSIRLFYGNTCVWRLSWDIQITVITIWGKWCAFCIDVRRKISSIALIYFMVVYKWFCNDPKLISKLEIWKHLLNMSSMYNLVKWKWIRMAITFKPNIWNSNIHMMLSNYDYAPPPDQYIWNLA